MDSAPLLDDFILLGLVSGEVGVLCKLRGPTDHLVLSQKEDHLRGDFISPPKMLVICQASIRDLGGSTKPCKETHPVQSSHELSDLMLVLRELQHVYRLHGVDAEGIKSA